MKRKILIAIVAVIAIAALIFGYVQMSRERKAEATADQPMAAASRVRPGTNGEMVVTFDSKSQQLIGLQVATLDAATLPMEI